MDYIKKGILFLSQQQQKDGSFAGSESTFLTSLILSCLNNIEDNSFVKDIRKKSIDFLLKQKSEHWSFNYWKSDSSKNKELPYPDDLDDTFCALSAICGYDLNLLNGEALARITNILTAVENNEGGPYRTWIVSPEADEIWKDVDVAVNSNIAYFLAKQDVFLPNVRKFLLNQIKNNNIASKYYPTIFPVAYFLARYFCLDKKITVETKLNLQKIILSQQVGDNFGNPLFTALAVSALLLLGVELKTMESFIKYLYKTNKEGYWLKYPFCCDPVINKKQYFAGSKSLTTAFCLEAISLYHKKNEKVILPSKKVDTEAEQIYKKVVDQVEQRFSLIDQDLKHQALKFLKKMIKRDKDNQVVLMPYYFCQSLGKEKEKISQEFLVTLGMANLYGWIAYTIYDDFLDDEGKASQLSVANVCLRELSAIYSVVMPDIFHKITDIMDNANAWEIANTRGKEIPNYGDFSQLANKSLGHALGPLAILTELGYKQDSMEVKNFLNFFKNYIIARQLNDDAHDWEEDLNRGQINAVGAMILNRTKVKSKMQEVFWQEVFEDVAKDVLIHADRARKFWPALEKLLIPIEKSTRMGLQEQQESVAFLKTYSK